MKSQKPGVRTRSLSRPPKSPKSLQQSFSLLITSGLVENTADDQTVNITRSPKDKVSVSDTNLNANQESHRRKENLTSAKGDVLSDGLKIENNETVKRFVPEDKELHNVSDNGNQFIVTSPRSQEKFKPKLQHRKLSQNDEKIGKNNPKKLQTAPSVNTSSNDTNVLLRHIRDVQADTRKSARIIRDSRTRLLELQKKKNLTESDIKELGERNELLLREMERFERLTKSVQNFVGSAVASKQTKNSTEYMPTSVLEPSMYHEMKMTHPSVLLAGKTETPLSVMRNTGTRSKSEIDLTRKLNESYDMQEKLVADNADLEVKRYILYKELMTKDQNLETCRSQIKRLQGEMKLMTKENTLLMEKLSINNSEVDAAAMKQDRLQDSDTNSQDFPIQSESSVNGETYGQEIIDKLDDYKTSSVQLEKQLGELEIEVRHIQLQMKAMAPSGQDASEVCRGGGGHNTCFQQPAGIPPVPPMSRACGVCPPCPASCNPNGPPTPAERELQRLTIVHKQTEENFKTKVTECAMLRADLVKKKEELEKERCEHREVQNRLRELEMKFEGLATHTNMLLGTKEEAFETEVNVRALKQCYRQAREEIDELTILLKEQSEQLQDYRVKYLKAQQLVEEQRRQMDLLDMDNVRISEQINLEIHKIKLTFQEKLQELSALPDLLSATQRKLKDSQQQQALAEHKAEQLARELACAREKVHILLHKSVKPPEKQQDKSNDEKQMAMLQQRVTQLTETNATLKSEIERLKSNVIRMEEAVVVNEKRLQEKIHECAQLGGELDRARDEAARALQRANERTDTIRKCMQTSIAELERQLASSRATVKTAEKEREEIQARMQCQIKRLNDNFEQAQYRILGLQTQVQTLRRTVSSTDEGEGENENQECTCKTFFEDDK